MARGYVLIPDDIMERTDLTPSHKLILSVIGRLQGDKASCYPSLEHLAKASGISRRQAIRVVNDLAARKEIVRLHHPKEVNTYSVPWATSRALRKKWALERQGKKAAS